MANFITKAGIWAGKEVLDYFLKPLFIGESPLQHGIRVIPNVQSNMKLNYFPAINKLLKAYVKGFTGTNFGAHSQRTLSVVRLKAEASQDAMEFYQTVFETALNKGVNWNDITGTILEDVVLELFRAAVESDTYRMFWLADTYKETLSSTTYGNYSGTADTTYNAFTGLWKLIIGLAATTPTSSQIKKVAVADGAVAQVATITASGGTSANYVITVMGVSYTVAYSTDYATTVALMATTHAAALLLRGIVLTSSGDTNILTSNIPGQPFTAPTIASASTITGSVAATTANTAPTALAADEAIGYFKSMFEVQPAVLRNIPDEQKRIYADKRVVDNYIESLEDSGTYTDMGKSMLVDGIKRLTYRGIPIIDHNWAEYLDDFPHATGTLPGYPHRAVLTVPQNLVLGIDATDEWNEMKLWFNEDEEENRLRMKLKMGSNFVHSNLMVVMF